MDKVVYNVKNRSSGMVIYRIPEDNIRREFAPGEVKKISFEELEKLTFQPGGRNLMENFLQIQSENTLEKLGIKTEIEYNMSEQEIAELLVHGSLDAFLDCLDFAPVGVIDLVKQFAVALPLEDIHKREALKNKTGFDVTVALQHIKEEQMEELAEKNQADEPATERRVKKEEQPKGRRVSTPNYKVVSKSEE